MTALSLSNRETERARREATSAWLMGAPAFLGLSLFLLLPFIFAIVLSFSDQRLLSPNPTEFVGMENYDRLLAVTAIRLDPLLDDNGAVQLDEDGNVEYPRARTILRGDEQYQGFSEWFQIDLFGSHYLVAAKDPTFYRSLGNNFIFAVIVVPLQSSLALLLAMMINQKDIRFVNVFRTIYFSPVVTSMVVISVVWVFLYSENGLINQFISAVTFGAVGPFDWLTSPASAMVAIIIMSVWQGVGFQMVVFLAGLQGIPRELYEAASIDGAGTLRKFWNVTIPQLRNTIIFVAISTTILAFRLFTQVDVMTSGGPQDSTTTVVFHAVEQGFRNQRIAYGSTISVVFFIIVLGIALIQRRVFGQGQEAA